MRTERVDPRRPESEVIARAAEVILGGGLVAFPTETVYGLGANALDEAAVERIYAAKGRPSYNPLIAHVPDAAAARSRVRHWPAVADRLAEAFWPGPLTLVLERDPSVPAVVSAGLATLAVRVPAHPVPLALLRAAGVPIVAPSANPSTGISPTRAAHVERGLGDAVELILDAGPTGVGIESTVVDLTGPRPVLLRPGALSDDDLAPILGPLARPEPADDAAGAPRSSPGMMERHYAPRAEVVLFEPHDVAGAVARGRRAAEAGEVVGALLREVVLPAEAGATRVERLPAEARGYARDLYAALHRLDDAGCDLILAEAVPAGAAWAGIRDRLGRASARG